MQAPLTRTADGMGDGFASSSSVSGVINAASGVGSGMTPLRQRPTPRRRHSASSCASRAAMAPAVAAAPQVPRRHASVGAAPPPLPPLHPRGVNSLPASTPALVAECAADRSGADAHIASPGNNTEPRTSGSGRSGALKPPRAGADDCVDYPPRSGIYHTGDRTTISPHPQQQQRQRTQSPTAPPAIMTPVVLSGSGGASSPVAVTPSSSGGSLGGGGGGGEERSSRAGPTPETPRTGFSPRPATPSPMKPPPARPFDRNKRQQQRQGVGGQRTESAPRRWRERSAPQAASTAAGTAPRKHFPGARDLDSDDERVTLSTKLLIGAGIATVVLSALLLSCALRSGGGSGAATPTPTNSILSNSSSHASHSLSAQPPQQPSVRRAAGRVLAGAHLEATRSSVITKLRSLNFGSAVPVIGTGSAGGNVS